MKLFGRKSAGRALARPALARGFGWGWARTEAPATYEAQVRAAYLGNPVAQRAVRLVTDGVGNAPLQASDDMALLLVTARTGGQALTETVALHLLLHGNAFVQVTGDALFALRPERVTVETDARGWPVAYLYRAGEAVMRLPAEDAGGAPAVIHIKGAHPLDDHYGLGCLGAAAGAVAIHNAATAWMPLAPVHLSSARRSDGGFDIHWIRRSREGWRWRDGIDAPLGEERESYRVTRTGAGLGALSVAVESSSWVYSAAQVASDVAAGAASVTLSIAQSGSRGISRAAAMTVALA
jgi:Phage portal protein